MNGRGEREDDGRVDVEAAFADIVARWDVAPGPRGAWPAAEDCDEAAGDARGGDPDGPADGLSGGPTDDLSGGLSDGRDDLDGRAPKGRADDPTGGAGGAAGAAGPAGPGTGTDTGAGENGAAPGQEPTRRPGVQGWGPSRSHVGGERVIRAAREDDERERALAAGGDDGHEAGFVPPEPPPLPRGDLVSRLAWGGVLGSPLFFLLCALAWRDVPRVLVVVAILAFVGGFVTLVVKLPSSRDDGWDDGAVL